MAQRALAEDVAARQAQQELAGRQLDLSEAEVFGFDQPEQPGLQGRSTMRQRALAEDIAARQAQQDLAREEIYGGVADGPQTLRQQALAEDIAARQERGELAQAELYGGPEGEAQTLQQQLVESQLAGVPMDRAMMLASQAIAAEEAGMSSLSEALTGQVQGVQQAQVRQRVNEATKRFEALGEDASFDDWFKFAEEYASLYPGIAEALQEDMGNQVNPTSEGSATNTVVRSGRQLRGGGRGSPGAV
jgi:hypothetical protein